MWIGLLSRFWPYLAGVAGLIAVGLFLHHQGYESGYAASEARWQRSFAAAEQARDAANAHAALLEAASSALTQKADAEHEQTVASLNLRAADAERRTSGLVRQLAARARCSAVPQASGSATVPDAVPAGDPVADRAAKDLTELARRCEADASALKALQGWVRGQHEILR